MISVEGTKGHTGSCVLWILRVPVEMTRDGVQSCPRDQVSVQVIFIFSSYTCLWNICRVPRTHLTCLSLSFLTYKMRLVPQSVSQQGAFLVS